MIVKDIMRKPFILEEDIPLAEAAKIMTAKKIGSLLMVEKDKLVGIVTERDIMKHFNENEKVSQAMTKNVTTIAPDASLQEALAVMKEDTIKRLPVVAKGELVGIITITDLIAHWEDIGGDEEFFF